ERDHAKMPHGGFVIHSGKTGNGHDQIVEFGLKLDSNPEFTASVLVAYARAAHRLYQEGQKGAKTIYDIGPGLGEQRMAQPFIPEPTNEETRAFQSYLETREIDGGALKTDSGFVVVPEEVVS